MPTADEIEIVNKQIRKTQFTRLILFADVVDRYAEIVLNDKISWLRTSALFLLVTRGGNLTPSQLATIMLRSNYSITKVIDGLEEDGLVKRRRNGKDRRSINIEVTSKGLDYILSSLCNVKIAEEELKSCLDSIELENLAAIIRKLRDKLIEKVSERYKLTADDKKAIFGKSEIKLTD